MNFSFLRTGRFWIATIVALLATGLLFAWELNFLSTIGLPGPPRFAPNLRELLLTGIILMLFSVNIGLANWWRGIGSCPMGTKKATGAAGAIGAIALLCPVCLILPLGIAGLSLSLGFLVPFVPILQVVAIILLNVSFFLLLPKKTS